MPQLRRGLKPNTKNMQLADPPVKGERINGDVVLAVRSVDGKTEMLWRGKWEPVELLIQCSSVLVFQCSGCPGHGAEWWTTIKPKNKHGIYTLKSDSGC